MALNIVQRENRAIPGRQLLDRIVECDPIDNRHGVRVFRTFDDLHGSFAVVGGLLHPHAPFAKVHQHLIHGQAVQPGGERRLPAKAPNLSKQLDETERVNAAIVALVKLLEGFHVAFGGFLRQSVI